MAEYGRLTRQGRLRRIHRLAIQALDHYDVDVVAMRLHGSATNLLYRIRTASGARFMLRMATPGWRTAVDLNAEALWLAALHADTDIGAPVVVPSRAGRYVVPMRGEGVPHTWNASLMTWVNGRSLAHALTPANLAKMGTLAARLHVHGGAWQPPVGFTRKRFDAFLSRGEPDVLFNGTGPQHIERHDMGMLQQARLWVERAYAELDRADLRVIHCDLWHENIKIDRGQLRPFDFEDTIWGYRLHDIAMGMLDLLETVGPARYTGLLSAFRAGYEGVLAWPQGQVAVLQIGRMLWRLNYIARFEPHALQTAANASAKVFRNFERTGRLSSA